MLHVLKCNLPYFPDLMTDYFYDEVVVTRNGIALVQREYVAEGMRKNGYDPIGLIEKEEDLPAFLDSLNKPKVIEERVSSVKKFASIKDVIDANKLDENKTWVETI